MQETLKYIKQAFELKSQQCYKQAIEMLYKALEIESDNIEILFQLGELYFLLNNFSRASQYLERVLKVNKDHIEALKILGKIYLYSNDLENTYLLYERILNLDNNTQNITNFIEICSKKGDLEKIQEFENTDDNNVLYAVAKAFYQNNKDAKPILEKILNSNNEHEDALVLLGKIYFDKGEFEKSKEIFYKFPKTSENPEILNYLGLFATEDLNFIEAIKFFSKASNIDKKNHKYFYNLANAYFYNGWFDEACKAYLKAIQMAPDNNGYRYSLAYLYYQQKNYERCQSEIDYILENDNKYELAHTLNALLKLENKDFLGAQKELEENLNEKNNFTLVSLAKVYSELMLYEKAEKIITKVLSNTPDSLNYQCQLAEIYIVQKKYDEALTILNNVIEKNENYITAYSLAAKANFESGDLNKAKDFAQKAIAIDMNFAGGYYYLALVRFEEKDYDEALECMKRAIMFDLNNAAYYAKMSEIYKAKEDYKTALDYIKEAESISNSEEYRIIYKELVILNKKNLTENKR